MVLGDADCRHLYGSFITMFQESELDPCSTLQRQRNPGQITNLNMTFYIPESVYLLV